MTAIQAQRGERGRFGPGNNYGVGRPRGSRNRLGEAFLTALLADFEENGVEAVREMRLTNPTAYCVLVARLLPREAGVDAQHLDDIGRMNDAELEQSIRDMIAGDPLLRALAAEVVAEAENTQATVS